MSYSDICESSAWISHIPQPKMTKECYCRHSTRSLTQNSYQQVHEARFDWWKCDIIWLDHLGLNMRWQHWMKKCRFHINDGVIIWSKCWRPCQSLTYTSRPEDSGALCWRKFGVHIDHLTLLDVDKSTVWSDEVILSHGHGESIWKRTKTKQHNIGHNISHVWHISHILDLTWTWIPGACSSTQSYFAKGWIHSAMYCLWCLFRWTDSHEHSSSAQSLLLASFSMRTALVVWYRDPTERKRRAKCSE